LSLTATIYGLPTAELVRDDGDPIRPQVIPEGAGPVKTNFGRVLLRFESFLVLAGRVEGGVGVKARAQPDRVAAIGP
jgi:hypothetical protein